MDDGGQVSFMAREAAQLRALQWLAVEPNTCAEWRRGSKAAYGPPEKWTHIRLSGAHSSIEIDHATWAAIRGSIAAVPRPDQQFGLTDEGRALLSKLQGTCGPGTDGAVAVSSAVTAKAGAVGPSNENTLYRCERCGRTSGDVTAFFDCEPDSGECPMNPPNEWSDA